MRNLFKIFLIINLIQISWITRAYSESRVIHGTVYGPDGKPVSGVIVTADKSKAKFFTSFDGAYQISVDSKSKYLKFQFKDREEKLNIEGNTGNLIDFGKKAEVSLPVKATSWLDSGFDEPLFNSAVNNYKICDYSAGVNTEANEESFYLPERLNKYFKLQFA